MQNNIRKDIICQLDQLNDKTGYYEQLKSCLKYDFKKSQNALSLDLWFKGVIDSLYYKPNNYCLILCSESAIGKTTFFNKLLPVSLYKYYTSNFESENLYNSLILNSEWQSSYIKYLERDNFRINDPEGTEIYPHTDKRLASYCSTTNAWHFPQRKSVIVLKVEEIDWELYNSIDKMKLWIEIFQMFKPLKASI